MAADRVRLGFSQVDEEGTHKVAITCMMQLTRNLKCKTISFTLATNMNNKTYGQSTN
ncbi:hypothetical protein SESBI_22642 [Sesbania bispinosa]|nr:hypothetical protein SESBI_22642 [Sesbania bispinosa]